MISLYVHSRASLSESYESYDGLGEVDRASEASDVEYEYSCSKEWRRVEGGVGNLSAEPSEHLRRRFR